MTKVFVNGTFDIVHYGHIKLLEFARSFENSYVLVMIDSDQRVKKLKGISRPINDQASRKYFLESIKFVDRVEIFNSDEELIQGIKTYSPDVMVKGGDYREQEIIGASFCNKIEFYDRTEHSTTKLIEHIADR